MKENMLSSCHLVGYSLAGLDARLVAQNNDAVRSVTTVGTPNRFKINNNLKILFLEALLWLITIWDRR